MRVYCDDPRSFVTRNQGHGWVRTCNIRLFLSDRVSIGDLDSPASPYDEGGLFILSLITAVGPVLHDMHGTKLFIHRH